MWIIKSIGGEMNELRKKTFLFLLCFIFLSKIIIASEIYLKADSFILNDKKKTISIKNAEFTYRDMKLSGDNCLYETKTQTGTLNGNVKITETGSIITGSRMQVFYKEKKALIKGNVKLVRGGSDQSGLTVNCDMLDYYWDKNEVIARGNVRIQNKDIIAYSNNAVYLKKDNLITLSGNVRFQKGSSDWMTSDSAAYDLTSATVTAVGNIEGSFYLTDTQGAPIPKKDITGLKVLEPDPVMIPSQAVDFDLKRIDKTK